jgi:hypothetical protein
MPNKLLNQAAIIPAHAKKKKKKNTRTKTKRIRKYLTTQSCRAQVIYDLIV